MKRQVPLLTAGYKGRSVNVTAQQRINLYAQLGTDAKNIIALIGTPGAKFSTDISDRPCRGVYRTSLSSKIWVVMGDKFIELLANGIYEVKGILNTSSGIVRFSDNGTHILIVDGSQYGYYYTIDPDEGEEAFIKISDADFVGGVNCQWIDGYFFVNDPATGKVRSCTAPSGTAPSDWNSIDVSTAEGDPDNIVSVEKAKQLLVLMGDFSTEFYYNAAQSTGLPFIRMGGAVIDIGLAAAHGAANIGDQIYWPAKSKQGDRFIVRNNGFSAERISTPDIDYELSQMSSVSDAYAMSYTDEGHSFYIITLPTGNKTFAYDASTKVWHERSSFGLGRWRFFGHVLFNGKHIVGDSQSGTLYELDLDTYKDGTDPIHRVLTWPHIKSPNNNRVFLSNLELSMELGTGLTTGQGDDPKVALKISTDGGHTWGNERLASIGKKGEYTGKINWPMCGSGYDLTPQIIISDPVKVVITGAFAEAEEGDA